MKRSVSEFPRLRSFSAYFGKKSFDEMVLQVTYRNVNLSVLLETLLDEVAGNS